jgi:hypothetical protein
VSTKPAARRKPTAKQHAESAALLLADAHAALRWYALVSKRIAVAWIKPAGADETLRLARSLADDAGRRAEQALRQRKTDTQ